MQKISHKKKAWAKELWSRLKSSIKIDKKKFVVDYVDNPFRVLVAIILSQNTNDKNAIRALSNLKQKVGLSPKSIANADLGVIEEAIKPAGLQRQKARTIKNLSRNIVNGLDIESILKMDVLEARKRLLGIEGIGKKTADVFLAIYGKRIMGVDTHAKRIARRLGITSSSSYDEIQRAYLSVFDFVDDFDYLHKLIISLGRKYCLAKSPRCDRCPISDLCEKNI